MYNFNINGFDENQMKCKFMWFWMWYSSTDGNTSNNRYSLPLTIRIVLLLIKELCKHIYENVLKDSMLIMKLHLCKGQY